MAAISFLPIDIHGRYKAIFVVGTPGAGRLIKKQKLFVSSTMLYTYFFLKKLGNIFPTYSINALMLVQQFVFP